MNKSLGLLDSLSRRSLKSMPKCVKCNDVFGLYTYNEELWCPKCLVARIHLLEGLLKGYAKEETFVSQKETPFERQCRMEIEAAAGRGLESGDPIE